MSPSSVEIRLIESPDAMWRVREFNATQAFSPASEVSLICESPLLIRRLRHFPANWHALPDAELLALFDIA